MDAATAFFLESRDGSLRYVNLFKPAPGTPGRGLVLLVPPWLEELNRSRCMLALGAYSLRQAGFTVLWPDLFGCGDSAGEHGEARWQTWLEDLDLALDRLRQEGEPDSPLWLWSLRSGALLASDFAHRRQLACHWLLWQPQPSGEQVLQQFLRLRLASDMGRGVRSYADTAAMRQALQEGQALHAAGYVVRPELALPLAATQLKPPGGVAGARLVWGEMASAATQTLGPASRQHIEAWRAAGYQPSTLCVQGPQFWASQVPALSHGLVEGSLRALCAEESFA
ncbi:hydrolase 2, exosortase A system-associated [Mitsuaria sp. WAJ17]|uniref:hydrolase 2, exosortase A system-associated n=1 Tax=Mitsuaria sp. WAJ17 TaxID=2761452 RepID=UPI0016008663|nr:hydrolase 2, exosortase A system-associated [Mitsuaria sp. WAJ17]MBB2486235.1 hydrolase 2, exosortase A system-associated [Mitsuaria sp. WAJ17]